jgi:hypothetical protein
MQSYFLSAIWCLFLLTAIVAYMPVMYIRKTNKILEILQRIETNTSNRKP